MSRGSTLRWIMLLGVILASVPTVIPTVVAAHPPVSTRMRLFARASQRSGVPLTVLIGLAWEQSMLSDHRGRPSIDGGFGLLDLSARQQHDTLGEAARLVDAAPSRLRHDDRLNVLGGALLLAHQERLLGYHQLPRSVGAWDRAVVAFTGMRSRFAAALIIKDMHRALERGIHVSGVRLAPIPLPAIHSSEMWLSHIRRQPNRSTETAGPADYPGAIWEPAGYNNYSDAKRPRDHSVRYIVIHDTESSCAAAVNWFQNPAAQASAHYVICLDGTVIQTVHERDIAWHAGNWPINEEAVGIEHEGYSDHADYTRAQYLASAALVRYLCHKYGIDPNRNVIFGHENVPAADHTDPGRYWNWDFYMREVRGDATGYTGGITSIATLTDNADVYSCPRQSCSVLGSANWGEEFAISKEQSGWDAMFFGGHTGWVPSAEIAAGTGNVLRVTNTTSVLTGPKAGNSALGTVSPGQSYVSLTRDNGFWYIYYNHRYGFVSTSAVRATPCLSPSGGATRPCLLNSGSALAATPNTGAPGTAVTVAGTGLAAGTVTITLAGQTLGTAHTGRGGSFNTTLTIPAAIVSGSTRFSAVDSSGRSIQTPFVIEAPSITGPQVSVTPEQDVLPGGRVAVSGSGFAPEKTVTITSTFPVSGGESKVVQLAPTGPGGSFASVKLSVPSAAAGSGTITVSAPGISVSTPVMLRRGTVGPVVEATVTAPSTTPMPIPVSATPTPSQPMLVLGPAAAQPRSAVQNMGFGDGIRPPPD